MDCSRRGSRTIRCARHRADNRPTRWRRGCPAGRGRPGRDRTAPVTSSSLVWSQGTARPCPPASVTSSAVSSTECGNSATAGRPRTLRPVTYTVAPSAPSATATPRPAPRLAPVTTAILPLNRVINSPESGIDNCSNPICSTLNGDEHDRPHGRRRGAPPQEWQNLAGSPAKHSLLGGSPRRKVHRGQNAPPGRGHEGQAAHTAREEDAASPTHQHRAIVRSGQGEPAPPPLRPPTRRPPKPNGNSSPQRATSASSSRPSRPPEPVAGHANPARSRYPVPARPNATTEHRPTHTPGLSNSLVDVNAGPVILVAIVIGSIEGACRRQDSLGPG